MFKIEDCKILKCEEKTYTLDNGKTGVWYDTLIRIGGEVYPMTSKIQLVEDSLVTLSFEFRKKTPKSGNEYTGIRIVEVVA